MWMRNYDPELIQPCLIRLLECGSEENELQRLQAKLIST